MKRLVILAVCVLSICSCSANNEPKNTETQVAPTTTITTTATQASPSLSTIAEAATVEQKETEKADYIDENGYLNVAFLERLRQFESEYVDRESGAAIITLQDFDFDNVPEIVYTVHDDGQGLKESRVYRAEDFHCYGSFDGFSRDGFTRFFNKYGGVVIHNYYEHSVSTCLDSCVYAAIENERLALTEISCYSAEKTADSARMVGTKYTNADFFEQFQSASVQGESSYDEIGFAVTANELLGENDIVQAVFDYYNSCARIKNAYLGEREKTSPEFSVDFLCIDDYDNNGKPEAFFQREKLGFIDSLGNVSYIELDEPFYVYGVNEIWNNIIVFSGLGNSQPSLIFTVENGQPREISEISGKGMMFDYSEFENGEFTLCDSAYDAPYHTWKPYFFETDENGKFSEFGAVYLDIGDFTALTGVDPYKVIRENCADTVEYLENDIPRSGESGVVVRSILYRANGYFHINFGHPENDNVNANVTIKCYGGGVYGFVYAGGGVYNSALCPEIAVYPESLPNYQ